MDFTIIDDGTAGYCDIIEWIDWVGHQARLNDCIPIFVIIPIEYYIRRDSIFLRIYLEVIKRSGHFYLDFRDIVKKYFPDTSAAPLYVDGAHPGEELSEKAADIIESFLANSGQVPMRQTTFKSFLRSFEILNLQDCLKSDNELTTRKSSTFEFRGVKIDGEHPGRFNAKPFDKLHGVVVNAARSHCNLSFLKGRLIKNFDLLAYGKSEFEARAVPLQMVLSNAEDEIEIAISLDKVSEVEKTMRSKKECLKTSDSIEISDLIIETGMRSICYDVGIPSLTDSNIITHF